MSRNPVRTRALLALLLVLVVSSSAVSADTAEDIEAVMTDVITGFANNDADALEPLLLDGCVLLIEGMGYAPDAMVMTAEDVLSMMRGAPPAPDQKIEISIDEAASKLEAGVAYVVGSVTGASEVEGDMTFVAALVNDEGTWQVAAIGALPDDTVSNGLDDAGKALVEDLGEGESTGMQAALDYLPTGASIYVVGGPDYLIVLAGGEAVRAQVGEWALPADVEPGDDVKVIMGKSLGFVFCSSTFTTEEAEHESSDLLFLHKQNGAWKIAAFIARSIVTTEGAAP